MLFAYGYTEIAGLLGEAPWAVAGAVVDGLLDPIRLSELAFAKTYKLKNIEKLRDRVAVEVIQDTCKVRMPASYVPIYGLGDLWALSFGDVAEQAGVTMSAFYSSQKRGVVAMGDLASMVDYVLQAQL